MSSPEKVDFRPAVDAIGNSPAKMATLMLLAKHPEDALSSSQLGKAFVAMQGDEPGWLLTKGSTGTPFSYCDRGMAPTLVTATEVPSQRGSRMVKAYEINNEGLEKGVPLSGAWLAWELEYDQTSTTQLLGYASKAVGNDRVPSLRLAMYEKLLASPNGMSPTQLQQAIGGTAARYAQTIPHLRNDGIIDVWERFNPSHRRINLSAPDFANLHQGGPRVHPETAAIFEVADELVRNSKTAMTGQEFLDEVAARYPQYDPAEVWRRLSVANSADKMRFVAIEDFDPTGNQQTLVTVSEAYRASVTALVESVVQLETDADFRTEMNEQAHNIMADSELMADLMAKAHGSSSYGGHLSRDEWRRVIVEHIPATGIDVRSLYDGIRPDRRPVNYTQFRRIVSELAVSEFKITWNKAQGKMGRKIGYVTLAGAS